MLISEAIRATRQHVGQSKDSLNRLDGAIDDSTTSVTFEFATPLPTAGSVIEVRSSSTSELMYVWSVTSQTATVLRGHDGSTPASFADEDLVAINPVLSYADTYREIQRELEALPSEGLPQLTSTTVTYSYTNSAYDTSAVSNLIRPLALEYAVGGRDHWDYDLLEHPDLIRVKHYWTPDSAVTLHYATTFTAPTAYTQDLSTDLGVPATAQDVVPIGAAIRVFYAQEQLRGQANVQQHARASEDVAPGSGARSVALLQQWKATRLAHEQRRQRERFPRRRL